jgi:hypothetical protein
MSIAPQQSANLKSAELAPRRLLAAVGVGGALALIGGAI